MPPVIQSVGARRGFSIAVEIQVESASATTVDFSTCGVYFETALPFVPEQEILIVFPFHHTVPGARAEDDRTNVSRCAEPSTSRRSTDWADISPLARAS